MQWRKYTQWFSLMAAAVLLPLPGQTLAADQTPLGAAMSAGQQYFLRYCSACHGLEGRGDGPSAAALRIPPADLTRIAQRRGGQFPVTEIAAYIDGRTVVSAHGSRQMPIWGERFGEMVGVGGVSEEVVRGNVLVLIEYLKTIQR